MKEPIVNDFVALVGIDWADKKHDVCELPYDTKKYKYSVISCKPESLNDWALSLKKRYPGKQVPLTDNGVAIKPNRIMIELLVPQLKLLIESVMRMDNEIKKYYKNQDDRILFDSFPGAGPQLAPRLLVAFGVNREKYNSASEIQKSVGVAPVIEQSGQKSWTYWLYSCPKFLRQTFVEWAGQSVRYSFWAKAYYEQQISKGNHIIR